MIQLKETIALSFIAPTDYQHACYYWNTGESTFEYSTDLFPEILPKLFPVNKLILFVTEEAEKHSNCQRLQAKLGDLLKTERIPQGKSEEELWEIFSTVAKQVPRGAHIIIDITHGFRSLPLIVFNIATYLRRVKDVVIERIVYGNFEARDNSFNPPRTPIFDLTLTLDLQDWLHGIDAFQRRGDAEELANSLERTQDSLYNKSTKSNGLPQQLKNTAKQLRNFSEAFRLLRPLDTVSYATNVCNLLDKAQGEASLWAKPFANILNDLKNEILPLQIEDSTILNLENLQTQLRLIKYYIAKDLVVQAFLLAREWMVSMLMFRTNRSENWRDRRESIEEELRLVDRVFVQKKISETEDELPFWFRNDPQSENIANLWSNLSKLRNDIAHCAMNTDAALPHTIRSKIKELIQSLKALLSS
jgi:CRISPR-associated DxTHG motif protein